MHRPAPQPLLVLLAIQLAACGPPAEICGDGIDNDRDLLVDCWDDDCDCADTGLTCEDPDTWYADEDGDGFGDPDSETVACEQPSDFVADASDCDDDDDAIHPDAQESCNGVDDDCDGLLDEDDATDATTWYLDQDGDGYGGSTAADHEACDQPTGFVDNADDCDDTDESVHPDAIEECDGVDQDCDDVADQGTECFDDDGDGQTEEEGDCDDEDDSVYSGAASTHEGIEMAYICPGTFSMGSPEDEVGHIDDETQHPVTLTRGFYIGVYEVTQAKFGEVMKDNPSANAGCDECPVEQITWHVAAQFANEVSDLAGLADCYECKGGECELSSSYATPYDCIGYRLPTEAEWEFAARAGTVSAFSNGGSLSSGDEDNCDGTLLLDNDDFLDDIAIYCGNDDGQTDAVGGKAANPWNLYDLHGNVWEWCHDFHGEYADLLEDPVGAGSGTLRLARGGSYGSPPSNLRSASRMERAPSSGGAIGLRLARTAIEEE